MSNWSSMQLTDLGRALDAKVTAGTTLLSFTKMKLGSGTETAEDIPAMTDLVSPKLVLGISSCAVSASDDTICELISVASSSDMEDSFVVRELGVFATDPDVGEILYAVMLDSTPDTMPNENVSSPVTVTYQVNIVSANASSITAVIDPAGLVTASVLQGHNDSISAHKMAHWYRQNSKAYAVGDIAFSASLPSSLVLECTTAGPTGATEPDFSGATEGNTVTDGEVTWTYRNLLSGGSVPVGFIMPYAGTGLAEGFLDCDGSAVSRTMYPALFAAIGTTWGAGNGSTTFNLPRSEDLVLQGASATNPVGTYLQAGLPNIKGELTPAGASAAMFYTTLNDSGAMYSTNTYIRGLTSSSEGTHTASIGIDASRSNAIYGNSDTVQPPAACVRFMIKAFDGPTPSSAGIDLTQYAQDLANRLTREHTPAFNKRDVVMTSGTYTAPVTGWYKIEAKGGGGGGGAGQNVSTYLHYCGAGGGEGGTTIAYEHLTAGDTVPVVIGAGGVHSTSLANGGDGGDSSVTVNSNVYTGGGGHGGMSNRVALPSNTGGSGTIPGACGASLEFTTDSGYMFGGNGGGAGGAAGANGGYAAITPVANSGGGGGGGTYQVAASDGADGYVSFEYFAAV